MDEMWVRVNSPSWTNTAFQNIQYFLNSKKTELTFECPDVYHPFVEGEESLEINREFVSFYIMPWDHLQSHSQRTIILSGGAMSNHQWRAQRFFGVARKPPPALKWLSNFPGGHAPQTTLQGWCLSASQWRPPSFHPILGTPLIIPETYSCQQDIHCWALTTLSHAHISGMIATVLTNTT